MKWEIEALAQSTGTEAVIDAKRAEIEALQALPYAADHCAFKSMRVTVAQHWARLDRARKGAFLREWRVRVEVDKRQLPSFRSGSLYLAWPGQDPQDAEPDD